MSCNQRLYYGQDCARWCCSSWALSISARPWFILFTDLDIEVNLATNYANIGVHAPLLHDPDSIEFRLDCEMTMKAVPPAGLHTLTTNSNNGSNNHESDDGTSRPTISSYVGNNDTTKQQHHLPLLPQPNTMAEFRRTFSVWQLLDPNQPWVLVPNGSLLGFFDWVPIHLRVGPWSIAAICYLTALWYLCALSGAYFMSQNTWWQSWDHTVHLPHPYIQPWTLAWYYHTVTFVYMVFIMYLLLMNGPLSFRAWATYTVQSWTLLTVRHMLCAVSPWSIKAAQVAEYIRFPVVCSASITFVIWNFVIAPTVYFVLLKTPEQKDRFFQFITSFRLSNIHIGNIIFCVLNNYYFSPPRLLEWIDFYWAVLSVVLYMTWYLCILDRLGIHLYPVFSPRAGSLLVLTTWTGLLLTYLACFMVWRYLLMPSPPPAPA